MAHFSLAKYSDEDKVEDIPGFCKVATIDEVQENDYKLHQVFTLVQKKLKTMVCRLKLRWKNCVLNYLNNLKNRIASRSSLNQSPKCFSKIWWLPNSRSFSGDVIIGDIEAAEWRDILETVNEVNLGIKLIPIKKYIGEKIDRCIKSGEWERKRKFLRRI